MAVEGSRGQKIVAAIRAARTSTRSNAVDQRGTKT